MKKEELEKEKSDIRSAKTVCDQVAQKMAKQDVLFNQMINSSAIRAAAAAVSTFDQGCGRIAKAIEPLKSTMGSFQNIFHADQALTAAATSIASVVRPLGTESYMNVMGGALENVAAAMQPYHDMQLFNSGILSVIESATKTPELLRFQSQLERNLSALSGEMSVVSDYVGSLTSQWDQALAMTNIAERSIAAQNFAIVRVIPEYEKLELPRGSKRVLKSLTKRTAEKLTQTEKIMFDPKKKEFYHKDFPKCALTADQVTVAESSQALFADISLDELLSFESQLYEDVTFAMEHPTGKKIFGIIQGWKSFIDFDHDTYFHARPIEEGKPPFLDQEMLKAPTNVSSHGRYNAIGKSCYYVAETKEGALTEIRKHSGGKKLDIQVVGLRPVKHAKMIDLSGEIKGTNRFMEHMRFTVENEIGKIVKNYLLPNFVASCCKKIGIDGIKYRSTGYNCCVLWKDDYFEFVDGSREIICGKT